MPVLPCCTISFYLVSCHVMSFHVMSCHFISCHFMSFHVISCRFMSCHVMICHFKAWHGMPWPACKYLLPSFSCLIHSFKRLGLDRTPTLRLNGPKWITFWETKIFDKGSICKNEAKRIFGSKFRCHIKMLKP